MLATELQPSDLKAATGGPAEAAAGALKPLFSLVFPLPNIGAGEEIRTLDPNLGKVVLYH